MKVADAIALLNISAAELGRRVGITRVHASDIVREAARPSPDLADRISTATDGLVSIEELLYPDGVSPGARIARDTTAPPEAQPDAPGDAPAPQGVNDDNAATTAAGDRRAA